MLFNLKYSCCCCINNHSFPFSRSVRVILHDYEDKDRHLVLIVITIRQRLCENFQNSEGLILEFVLFVKTTKHAVISFTGLLKQGLLLHKRRSSMKSGTGRDGTGWVFGDLGRGKAVREM